MRETAFKALSIMLWLIMLLLLTWLLMIMLSGEVNARGVEYGRLLNAISIIESSGDSKAVNAKEQAFGLYQIRAGVIQDVNEKVYKYQAFNHNDAFNPILAKTIAINYLQHYGKAYKRRTGKDANEEVLARIWNGGYSGYFKNQSATDSYWLKVKQQIER